MWSLIANAHRDEKQRREPYEPADIHPFMAQQKKAAEITIGEAARIAKAQEAKYGKRD